LFYVTSQKQLFIMLKLCTVQCTVSVCLSVLELWSAS